MWLRDETCEEDKMDYFNKCRYNHYIDFRDSFNFNFFINKYIMYEQRERNKGDA